MLRGGGFACAQCLGAAGAVGGGHSLEVGVGGEGLGVVPEFCYLGDMLSAGGGCELAAVARCKCAWGRFRRLLPLLASCRVPLLAGGWVCSSCVGGVVLHAAGAWALGRVRWAVSGVVAVPWSVGSAVSGQGMKWARAPFSQSLASGT